MGRLSTTGRSAVTGSPAQLARSFIVAGPNPPKYRFTRSSIPSASVVPDGPSQSSASPYRSARRFSHVPEGGTRTRSSHSPAPDHAAGRGKPSALRTSVSSACRRGPSFSSFRSRAATIFMSSPVT
jgi:hypothetical protein